MSNKLRVAVIALHPIIYQTPLFRDFHRHTSESCRDIEQKVFFCSDLSLRNVFFNETSCFFKPDTPDLLKGFSYKILKNIGRDGSGFLSRINPNIIIELNKFNPDFLLVHGIGNVTSILALIYAKLLKKKIIYRGESTLRAGAQPKGIKYLILKMIYSLFDSIFYSCEGNRLYFQFFNVPSKKLKYYPCSVDNDFFTSRISQSINRGDNKLKIIFPARFTDRKNPLTLINAVASARNKESIRIIFVGDGPLKTCMKEMCESLGVDSEFTGFVNQTEIPIYYSQSDIGVIISDYDPSPKTGNEMLCSSLALIVSKQVGTAVNIIDGNGFILDNNRDVREITHIIDFLFDNPEKLNSMKVRSRIISEQYRITRNSEVLEKTLREIK